MCAMWDPPVGHVLIGSSMDIYISMDEYNVHGGPHNGNVMWGVMGPIYRDAWTVGPTICWSKQTAVDTLTCSCSYGGIKWFSLSSDLSWLFCLCISCSWAHLMNGLNHTDNTCASTATWFEEWAHEHDHRKPHTQPYFNYSKLNQKMKFGPESMAFAG